MNAPTAATDTAEQWRMWAVLTYRDDAMDAWYRRRDIDRELRARERERRRRNRGRVPTR